MYTGLIRIKYREVGKWLKEKVESGKLEVPDSMHVTTEGSDTVNIYPMAAPKLRDIQNNLKDCTLFAVENIGEYNAALCVLMKILVNNLADGLISQDFSMLPRP